MANQTRQLANLLAGAGLRVEVVQVNAPYRPQWVGRVRVLRAAFRLFPYLAQLWRCAGHCDFFHVMANSGWSWHLFAAPAVLIAWIRGIPVVVNYRGGQAEGFLRRQIAWVRPTLRRATIIAVPSAFLKSIFAQHGFDTEIVPNAVDLERFFPAEQPPGRMHIIITRNLEPIYGIDAGLRAFEAIHRELPEARLSIAGIGPQRAELESLAKELGIEHAVRFTGRLDGNALPVFYRTADLMLNPSTADNMPNSILESLASGVPVVSTDAGGIPHLVRNDHTALLVPIGDSKAMAAAALRVFRDAGLAAGLRSHGRQLAQAYAWPRVRDRLFMVYARALGVPVSALRLS
jgi:glycosyltransferase involved in cell wall biosynthesis